MPEQINTLMFNDILVDSNFRSLLEQRFSEDDAFDLFNKEINLVPFDSDLKELVDLPAVTITVYQSKSLYPDDVQIQQYTPFTVEINVYTSGESKVLNNHKLCNIIIEIMQSNGQLKDYYCRGLSLEENRPMNTFLDSAYRRIIRMSGLCDNNLKLITRR